MNENPKSPVAVPDFSRGDTREVRDYIMDMVKGFCEREAIAADARDAITEIFLGALRANTDLTKQNANKGLTDVSPEATKLRDALCGFLVEPESRLCGAGHFRTAQEHMAEGGNVLLVQLHTSIADMLVTVELMRKEFGGEVTDDWAYMSGSPMNNLSSLQSIISGGFRRFRITSKKFQSLTDSEDERADMQMGNVRSMKALIKHAETGGKLVVLYPEGRRNGGTMQKVEPTAMNIPRIMAKTGKRLMILPTAIDGADKILPPNPADINEHSTTFQRCSRGKADMAIGAPVNWDDIADFSKDPKNMGEYIQLHPAASEKDTDVQMAIAADIIGKLIADLISDASKRGYYKDPKKLKGFTERPAA
jgi:hypothetical protein